MNHNDHVKNSVTLFGGKPTDYEEVHKTIDMNKAATLSVYGRFLLHHIDLGGAILEKIFGVIITNSNGTKVPVRDILKQHLIEDYNDLPTFEYWYENFEMLKFGLTIAPKNSFSGDRLRGLIEKDELLRELRIKDIDTLLSLLDLSMFKYASSKTYEAQLIFGHATGVLLAEKIIGPFVGDSKVATVDAMKKIITLKFGGILTLEQFEGCITHKKWMLAPKGFMRKTAANTKKKMAADYKFTRISEEREEDKKKVEKRTQELDRQRKEIYREDHYSGRCGGPGVFD